MLKKLWLKLRFLNIWNWAQLGVMLFTLLCFVVVTFYSFTYIIENQAKTETEKNFQLLQNFMQENGVRLRDAAEQIALAVESGDIKQVEKIKKLNSVALVGNKKQTFDMLFVVDKQGNSLYCENGCEILEEEKQLPAVKKALLQGTPVISVERVAYSILKSEGIAEKAVIKISGTSRELNDALVRMAVVPYDKNGEVKGVVAVGMLMNNNTYLPDWFSGHYYGIVSVFMDGYRVLTNLTDKNNIRLIGTQMPKEVLQKLYIDKEPFEGKVRLQETAYSIYDYLYNADNKPVGVVGLAYNYERVASLFKNVLIVIWLAALGLGLFMVVFIRHLNWMVIKPIRDVADGVIKLAKNKLDYRVPLAKFPKCWEIKKCNYLDCPARKNSVNACWLVENTCCIDGGKDISQKMQKCRECEVYLAYAKNETKQLIASFNFMASMIEKRTKDLHERQEQLKQIIAELGGYESVILTLALAVEAKDPYTRGHSERVAAYAAALGKELGLDDESLETLRIGTILHDIGKIAVNDEILLKPDSLTKEEFNVVKEHPVRGAVICENLSFAIKSLPIILHHHERFDGNGYPDKLKGEEIPFLVRITTIADAFDAMTSDRPYRPGIKVEHAIEELRKNAGRQFDPHMTEVFISLIENQGITVLKTHDLGA